MSSESIRTHKPFYVDLSTIAAITVNALLPITLLVLGIIGFSMSSFGLSTAFSGSFIGLGFGVLAIDTSALVLNCKAPKPSQVYRI